MTHITPETPLRVAMDVLRAHFAKCYPNADPSLYGLAAARMLDAYDAGTLPYPSDPTSPANAVETANAMHWARGQQAVYTFRFDGQTFTIKGAPDKLTAFGEANAYVRAHGVTDAFAWFDSSRSSTTFVLVHNVSLD